MGICTTDSRSQGINTGITCDPNLLRRLPFINQILLTLLRGRKVIFTYDVNCLSIKFLRPRTIDIMRTKTSFYMSDRNLQVETSKRGSKTSRSISMNKHDIRFFILKNSLESQ